MGNKTWKKYNDALDNNQKVACWEHVRDYGIENPHSLDFDCFSLPCADDCPFSREAGYDKAERERNHQFGMKLLLEKQRRR